jgi:hypothetical protein
MRDIALFGHGCGVTSSNLEEEEAIRVVKCELQRQSL